MKHNEYSCYRGSRIYRPDLSAKSLSLGHRVIVVYNFHEFYPLGIKIRNILESTDNKELIKYFKEIEESSSKKIKKRRNNKSLM